ncbi:MAG: YwqG family protein [Oscillospiraceae bacterium]
MCDNRTYKNIIEDLKKSTIERCIKLTVLNVECSQFDSKVGGTPYIPNNFEYPYSTTDKTQPLMLLAQINFEQMPTLKNFPNRGILQFYVNPYDDVHGLNFRNPTEQSNFRVVYHEVIDYSAYNMDKIPKFNQDDVYMPFEYGSEYKLLPNIENQPITLQDCRFHDTLEKVYKRYYPSATHDDFENFYDGYFDELCDYNCDISYSHLIGGYPYFTQDDVRNININDDNDNDYSILLFQLDSDWLDNENIEIMWGDCGVGNFFISPKDLENRDFSNVLYNWDCC